MSGYYVRRQGDDSDYLEHSLFGNVRSQAHKYLAKLPTPGGGFRYIYNQAELLAARAGKAVSNVKRAADNAIGFGARKRWQNIHNRAEAYQRKHGGNQPRRSTQMQETKAHQRYNKTLLGRAERALNSARNAVGSAGNAARNAIGNAVGEARRRGEGVVGSIKKGAYAVGGQVAKATGLEARGRMNRLGAQRQRILKGNGSRGLNAVNQAYNSAKSSYNKSILGRAENAFNSARGAVSGAVSGARNAASNAVGKVRAKGQSAIDAAVGAGRGAAATLSRASGLAAQQRADRLRKASNRHPGNTDLKRAANRAEIDTYHTPLGRLKSAVDDVRSAANDAVGKARSKGQQAIKNAHSAAREGSRIAGINRGERRRTKQNLDRATAERDRLERGIEAARVKNGEFYDPNDKLEIARDRARRRAQAKVNSATTAYNNAHSKGKRRRT